MVPDFRHRECRYWHYHQNLPSVSIIIIFKNEDLTIIKRTIQSIITAGPYQLIEEILIYDDGSDLEDIDELLLTSELGAVKRIANLVDLEKC